MRQEKPINPELLPARIGPQGLAPAIQAKVQDLLAAYLSGKSKETLRAYQRDITDFSGFLGVSDRGEAVGLLLSQGPGEGNFLCLSYRSHLLERGLSPATVNRRLNALRSLVKMGRTLGLVNWGLDVPGVKSQAYRDTSGPDQEGVKGIFAAAAARTDLKGTRDLAMIRLLYDLGLRRGAVCRLDIEDVDTERGRLFVLEKRRTQKEPRTLPDPTKAALRRWLKIRGTDPGPLFVNLDRWGQLGDRLSGRSLDRIVKEYACQVGVKTSPHGLRHAAITRALDVTSGDIRAVQKFSGHQKIETLILYDDNRRDFAGEVARLVADSVKIPKQRKTKEGE